MSQQPWPGPRSSGFYPRFAAASTGGVAIASGSWQREQRIPSAPVARDDLLEIEGFSLERAGPANNAATVNEEAGDHRGWTSTVAGRSRSRRGWAGCRCAVIAPCRGPSPPIVDAHVVVGDGGRPRHTISIIKTPTMTPTVKARIAIHWHGTEGRSRCRTELYVDLDVPRGRLGYGAHNGLR